MTTFFQVMSSWPHSDWLSYAMFINEQSTNNWLYNPPYSSHKQSIQQTAHCSICCITHVWYSGQNSR